MELQAVKLAWLRLTRNVRNHGCRGLHLVDAQAVCGALRKGRSSSETLRSGIAAVAALALASDVRMSYAYLPSESMPADPASRGIVKQRTARKASRSTLVGGLRLHLRALRLPSHYRRIYNL